MSKRKVSVGMQIESPPEALVDFVLWAGRIYDLVPFECRGSAMVKLRVWDDAYSGVEHEWALTYKRNETAEEEAKRVSANERRGASAKIAAEKAAGRKAAKEREIYERLRKKFEGELEAIFDPEKNGGANV